MAYDEEGTKSITDTYDELDLIRDRLILKLTFFRSKLKNEKAVEYLMEGVGRRLKILTKCIHNIFRMFPINQTELLSQDDLTDIAINLHAFFINVSGILDNLAWVFVYENNLTGSPKEGKISKRDVGLFNKKTQKHFNPEFTDYLKSDTMKFWHAEYTKNYRDALAHRIPLYVPPAALNDDETEEYMSLEKQLWDFSSLENLSIKDELREKQNKLGQACPFFVHSSKEGTKPLYLHAQVIADYITIEDVINKYCDYHTQ